MAKLTFYWKGTCSTCRDARKVLVASGRSFDELNYSKNPLPASVVESIAKAAGGVAVVLNTRHEIAKEKGWKENAPGVAEFAKAAAKEPNLLRRPILIEGGNVTVGFEKAVYEKL